MPKVSVIIPVYNVEKYLKKCLDSVIGQTLQDIEIICINDESTDNSLSILRDYEKKDSRIKILTQKNQYAGVARNNGLKAATGEYLSFLDSDDFFDIHMLEDMYNKAKKDDSDVVVCGFYKYNNHINKITSIAKIPIKFVKKSPFSPLDFKDSLFDGLKLNAWTKLFRRKLFTDNDLQFEKCICCNDLTCVCTALALSNKISIINKPYIYYRYNQKDNLTANRNKSIDGFLVAAKGLEENLKKFNIYEVFEKAFVSRIKASFDWELSLCTPEQKAKRKIEASKCLSKNLYNIFYGNTVETKNIVKKQKRKNRYF